MVMVVSGRRIVPDKSGVRTADTIVTVLILSFEDPRMYLVFYGVG